jgi:hypothetical protein
MTASSVKAPFALMDRRIPRSGSAYGGLSGLDRRQRRRTGRIGDGHDAEIKRHIADLVRMGSKPNQQVLKLIVDASCTADHKTRSRWGQALRYVWRRRKRKISSGQEFNEFLHCHGGVVGCAARFAKPKTKLVEGRLGRGFDSLAFQRMIALEQSSSARGNVL